MERNTLKHSKNPNKLESPDTAIDWKYILLGKQACGHQVSSSNPQSKRNLQKESESVNSPSASCQCLSQKYFDISTEQLLIRKFYKVLPNTLSPLSLPLSLYACTGLDTTELLVRLTTAVSSVSVSVSIFNQLWVCQGSRGLCASVCIL